METNYGYRSHKDSIRQGVRSDGRRWVGWEKKTFTVVVMKYYTLPCTFATTLYYTTLSNTFIYKMGINYLVCWVDGYTQ